MGKKLYDLSAKVAQYGKDAEGIKKTIFDLDLPRYKYIVDSSNLNYKCNFALSTEDFVFENDDFAAMEKLLNEHISKASALLKEIKNVGRILSQERQVHSRTE